jgi:MFS family permease
MAVSPASRPQRSPGEPEASRWWIVVLLFAAILVNYLDRGSLSVAAVPLMREFGLGPAAMGTLLSAFFWTYGLLQIPAGWIVDRFGLKWTYAGGFLLWSLASAGVALASSPGQVLALRLVLGVGEAVAPPASLAYIRVAFRREEQGLPTAIYLSGMMLGPAVGALLGGALLDRLGWRLLFALTGLGGCAWLVPWLVLAPAGRGAVEAARSAAGPRWSRVLRSRALWGITAGSFCYSYAWNFYITWLPSYFVLRHGASYLQMGTATSLPLLGTALMSVAAGRAADRLIRRWGRPVGIRRGFVVCGFAIAAAGLLALGGATTIRSATAILVVALIGIGLASANYWALTQALAPGAIIGRVIGYQNTIANAAGICAPIATGLLLGLDRDFGPAILAAALALAAAAAAFLLLVRERDITLLEPDAPPGRGGARAVR